MSSGPVLSIYAAVEPGNHDATRQRIEDSLKATLAPPEFIQATLDDLDPIPGDGTLVYFRSQDVEERIELERRLPVVEPQTGRVMVRFDAEPWLLPLEMTLDGSLRVAVALPTKETCRLFEVHLGEIEELSSKSRIPHEGFTTTDGGSKQVPGQARTPGRDDAHLDRKQDHEDELRKRLYDEVAEDLRALVDERHIDRVLVMGGPSNQAAFLASLPKALEDITLAAQTQPSHPDAPPSEVLAACAPQIETMERERVRGVLDEIEARGVSGVDAVLDALQKGRAQRIVVPWRSDATAFRTDTGYITGDEAKARALMASRGEQPVEMTFDHALAALPHEDVEIVAVSRDDARFLVGNHGGAAAIYRW